MKKSYVKKIGLITLMGMTALGLTGCTKVTSQSLLKDATSKMEKAESYAIAMKMDLEAGGSAMGITMDLAMNLDMGIDVDVKNELTHSTGTVSMEMLGQSNKVDTEIYSMKNGDRTITYTKTNDEWKKEENAEDLMKGYSFEDLDRLSEALILSEKTVEMDGVECYELKGDLTGEAIDTVMKSALGAMDSTGMFGDEDADWSDKKIPVAYYIAKSEHYPVKITMEMKEIMDAVLGTAQEETEVDFSCEKCTFEIGIGSFDKVEVITIPDEVMNASETKQEDTTEADTQKDTQSDVLGVADVEKIIGNKEGETEAAESREEETTTYETGAAADLEGKYSIQMNGKDLVLPFSYKEITDVGLKLNSEYGDVDEEYMVNKNDYTFGYMDDGNTRSMGATVYFYNDSDKAKSVPECAIGGIEISEYAFGENFINAFKFSGDLTFESTLDEIIAVLGEPTQKYNASGYSSYTWIDKDSYYKSIRVAFGEEEKITSVEIKNMNINE